MGNIEISSSYIFRSLLHDFKTVVYRFAHAVISVIISAVISAVIPVVIFSREFDPYLLSNDINYILLIRTSFIFRNIVFSPFLNLSTVDL